MGFRTPALTNQITVFNCYNYDLIMYTCMYLQNVLCEKEFAGIHR